MDIGDKYVGRILDNRYEILELIGTGGMALVYKARCHRLNRLVAIKILKEDLATDEEFRRRFHTESQAVAMLSHPNIVAVYDVNRSAGIEYIVMELIEGITLKQYINRKGVLNWKEALHFSTQIIKALGHAHSRGIIHRDVKPHNIMILKDGSVKVADFGIARLLAVQNTLTQEALGSVHYISPEQAKGGHVDARSDIYSLGVVMYEMLTSRLPFVGDSAVSVAIQHISAIPLMPRDINPDVPEGLENITMHAMEPNINLRFTTADEMLFDLEEFRKNPAIAFNYTAHDRRQPPDVIDEQATRPVPTGAALKAERVVERTPPPPPKRVAHKKPEMDREEYRTTSKRASKTSTLIGIFSIIVFIIVVAVFMWSYMLRDIFRQTPREPVTIPNFVGRMESDVRMDRTYDNVFNFVVADRVYSGEHAVGVITRQNPPSGSSRIPPAEGAPIDIEIYVSLGERQPQPMPNLINTEITQAQNMLRNLDSTLRVETYQIEDDAVTRGFIIETIPAAGEPLAQGGMVIIRYSAGPERRMVTIPDNFEGRRISELRSEFNVLLLVTDEEWVEDESPRGTVIFVAGVGQEVHVHTSVRVYVSDGPPEPPPTDAPTEPPTDPDDDVPQIPTDPWYETPPDPAPWP